METEPKGRRVIPPSFRTALGTSDSGGRTVLIHLRDAGEEAEVARLFQGHGWTVVRAGGEFVRPLHESQPILCITDSREEVTVARVLLDEACVLVCVTPDSVEDQVAAYSNGADWVEPRPLVIDEVSTLYSFARVE